MAEAISDYDRAAGPLDPPEAEASGANEREPEPTPTRDPLGSLLIDAGFITDAQLAEGLAEGTATGARLGEVVVRREWATEDDVARLLADQWELGYVDRASIFFDAEALARLSREQARSLEAIPTRMQDGRVVVAVAEPTEQRLAALRAVIGEDTVVVVVPKTALDAGLRSDLLSGSSDGREVPVPAPEAEPQAAEVVVLPPPVAVPVQHEDAPAATPPVVGVEPAPARASSTNDPELAEILVALEAAAGEATALEQGVSELAHKLAGLVDHVAAAAARLEQAGVNEREREARINALEEQLAQRTDITESLKAQLVNLTRTLEDYH
jgi:hypothetical protein